MTQLGPAGTYHPSRPCSTQGSGRAHHVRPPRLSHSDGKSRICEEPAQSENSTHTPRRAGPLPITPRMALGDTSPEVASPSPSPWVRSWGSCQAPGGRGKCGSGSKQQGQWGGPTALLVSRLPLSVCHRLPRYCPHLPAPLRGAERDGAQRHWPSRLLTDSAAPSCPG